MEDQYMEDIAQGARFDDTDDEEKDENNDSLVLADYEGDDLPTIEWNRADPQLVEGTVFQTMMDCRNALTTYCILSKNDYEVIKSEPVDPAFGMEDQAGAANAEEIEAAIQNEEIEAAIQHEEIEAAIQPMEIEAAIQHEEIEAAIQPMDRELLEPMDRELLEPMDREQREQMDRELLEPMDREQREQIEMIRQMSEQVEEQIVEAREENALEERAQASYDMVVSVLSQPEEKKKNKKEGKRKVDTDMLMMKNTKTAAVPTVIIDAKIIEAIAYNIASTAQIQPSMLEPVDASLPLPSSDPLLMKDTKTAAVLTMVIDAKIIEAIAYNIASTEQIQPSMSEPIDVSLPVPRVRIDAKTIEAIIYNRAAKPPIQPSSDPSLMKYTKTAVVPRVVAKPQIQPSSMSEFADGADDHPSAARRPGPSCPSLRGHVRRHKLG
ncbi:hypothetical protein QYE76_058711 [Lolium multiflorum]|uniref:Uncharacterized protein n=1 Tax=Lolium multiflorum TaxID=4521 RepID=A0AAD8WQ55_LOLMU|nr:hypothetical protein QYE76_058711 [Lolium multiflorum]